ncbi:hypothetical protein E4U51_005679 [Claviceps purpurea]|nr:hypothetical protein E4U51_005679 [Claviceps purpurea]
MTQAKAGHKGLWTLERWARLRSGLTPESRQIPPLLRSVGNNTQQPSQNDSFPTPQHAHWTSRQTLRIDSTPPYSQGRTTSRRKRSKVSSNAS